jgi:small-conductance mechanosensitive channel
MEIQTFMSDLLDELSKYYDEIVILLPKVLLSFIVIAILSFLLKFVRKRFLLFMNKRADDKLLVNFSGSILRITNVIILIFLFLVMIGQATIAGSLFGAAGLSAFVIGFALKDIIENFLAGVIMAFNRPFRLMDTIEINGITGSIIRMSLRETIIKTFDGKDVYIPNSIILKNPLYNYTIDGFLRKQFVVGVDYESNIYNVITIITNVLSSLPGILTGDKKPDVVVESLGSSTINLKVYYWINTFDKKHKVFKIHNDAVDGVLIKLVEEGIKMPAEIMELKNYTDQLNVGSTKISA